MVLSFQSVHQLAFLSDTWTKRQHAEMAKHISCSKKVLLDRYCQVVIIPTSQTKLYQLECLSTDNNIQFVVQLIQGRRKLTMFTYLFSYVVFCSFFLAALSFFLAALNSLKKKGKFHYNQNLFVLSKFSGFHLFTLLHSIGFQFDTN